MLSERFASPPIVATQSLRQIDLAVSTLLRLNYAVSIDMHSGDGFGALMAKRPDEALAALKEVWTTIAARYSSTPPDRVLFEVLNEPDVPAGRIAPGLSALQTQLQILFGSAPAVISYQGLAPGYVGLYQFNVVVPDVPDNDAVQLSISQGGTPLSQKPYIAVRR